MRSVPGARPETPVCRMRNFAWPDKIRELIARTSTKLNLGDKQGLDCGISNGRGGIYLDLTAEQYRKLKTEVGSYSS